MILIGFILSPLSWWNDLLVNIPISYLIALPFSYFNKQLLLPVTILVYWLTNIIGIVFIHFGTLGLYKKSKFTKKDLLLNLIFGSVYTLVIALLVKFGVLTLPKF